MMMDLFGARQKQLLHFLTADAERETLDYVLQGMREVLGEEMPEEDAVRAYLYGPEKATTLSAEQQIVAIDKLLECAEVNFRMLCDLIRYQQLKEAGVVNSMEEFLSMVRPDDFRDMKREEDQESATIKVYEGESRDISENFFYGEFTLDNIKQGLSGVPIQVNFEINEDRQLIVSAWDEATGSKKSITIEKGIKL